MNYEEMKNIVLEQSAKDMMCDKNDFLKNKITVISMTEDEKSQNRGNKKSIPSKLFCNLVYFGTGLVCTVDSKIYEKVKNLLENDLDKNELYRTFEPDFIYKLNEVLFPFERKINCMANFCLPSKNFFFEFLKFFYHKKLRRGLNSKKVCVIMYAKYLFAGENSR